MEDVKLVLEAPTFYLGAAVLIQQQFFMGKGDRTSFIEVVLNSDPNKIPDLGRKLGLIGVNNLFGMKIYNDKLCNTLNICQHNIYRLWLHCTRRHNAVSLQQMIDFAPYMEEKLKVWDRFVDKDGKTTLNPADYIEHRKQIAEKTKLLNLKKKSKKQNKNKI